MEASHLLFARIYAKRSLTLASQGVADTLTNLTLDPVASLGLGRFVSGRHKTGNTAVQRCTDELSALR